MKARRISHEASAVVTGAGSGIGRAFAFEVARRGGRVVCSDIREDIAEETATSIRSGGGEAVSLRCDVSSLDDLELLASEAEAWLGNPADLIINNAGVGAGGSLVGETPLDDWQWVLGINLWGVIHGCHVFVPRLRAQRRGGIINVASTASFAAAPRMGPYNVSKAAVLALSETLAAELVGSGVKVSALCPTFVKTNITRDGRITESSGRLADRLMRWSGVSADAVAAEALDALDRGQLYVLPQVDARLIWRLKRYAPSGYARALGLLNRAVRGLA